MYYPGKRGCWEVCTLSILACLWWKRGLGSRRGCSSTPTRNSLSLANTSPLPGDWLSCVKCLRHSWAPRIKMTLAHTPDRNTRVCSRTDWRFIVEALGHGCQTNNPLQSNYQFCHDAFSSDQTMRPNFMLFFIHQSSVILRCVILCYFTVFFMIHLLVKKNNNKMLI